MVISISSNVGINILQAKGTCKTRLQLTESDKKANHPAEEEDSPGEQLPPKKPKKQQKHNQDGHLKYKEFSEADKNPDFVED